MIGLGLRLVLSGGREAIVRLVVLAAAVGLGVGLLLTAVAGTNAVAAWNDSHTWMWTGTSAVPPGPATAGIAPLWWHPTSDTFDGQTIDRFDVAATGTSSPVPPGITRDPGPGQYYASPALAALLRGTPADELAGRYPGRLAGSGMDLVLGVIALGMLTPVLIFIATATRLSAARREQRFAAMRLAGATRKQVSLLAATEAAPGLADAAAAGRPSRAWLLRRPWWPAIGARRD